MLKLLSQLIQLLVMDRVRQAAGVLLQGWEQRFRHSCSSNGVCATAAANQSVAIGYSAKVTRNDSIAIGRETQANELNTVAIGLQTKANGNQSMALGYGALTERSANNGLAIGVSAYVGPIRSTDPVQGVPGNSTSVVDDDTVVEAGKEQMNSIALGNSAKAFGYQTTALGAGAEAHDTNSLAVGIMAIGKGNYATALGKQAYANGNEATALGHWRVRTAIMQLLLDPMQLLIPWMEQAR